MNNKGIALVQVLLITAMLSVVALYVSKSARQQVQVASWAMDKSQAAVILHSHKSELLFQLLTLPWQQVGAVESEHQQRLNLYNKPVKLAEGVYLRMQDQAGLINFHYQQPLMLTRLLSSLDISIESQRILSATLSDWQDSDSLQRRFGDEKTAGIRNGLMPDIREWRMLKIMNSELYDKLAKNFTLYGTSHLNLMTSPLPLLNALVGNERASKIASLRKSHNLSRTLIYGILGATDYDEVFYSPSNTLAISMLINYGEAQIKQELIVEFSPYAIGSNLPYNIMQTKGG